MADQFDKFSDIIEREEGGSLGGGGLNEFDSVRSVLSKAGLLTEVACRSCGRRKQLMISYPEIIALRVGVSPAQAFGRVPQLQAHASPWQLVQLPEGLHWMPQGLRCGLCPEGTVYVYLSPDECTVRLSHAKQRGFLSPEDEIQVGRICENAKRMGG